VVLTFPACDDLSIIREGGGTVVPILTSDAKIETPADLELGTDGILRLRVNGTGEYGCSFNTAGSNGPYEATSASFSKNIVNSTIMAHANVLNAAHHFGISSVRLRIRRVGTPAGEMYVEIRKADSNLPTDQVMKISDGLLISNSGLGGNGSVVTFDLPEKLHVPKGADIAIVLRPSSGASVDGSNNFRWVVVDGAGCTAFSTSLSSDDGGNTWNEVAPLSPSFFHLVADVHSNSGSASWIIEGAHESIWVMSAFTMAEDPRRLQSGDILYDIGAGEDPSVPTYTHTALTLAQVRALPDLQGRYLYVRAHLSVDAPGFDQAELGDGQIKFR